MFKSAYSYLRGAYIYTKIRGILAEVFEELDKKDVKRVGEEGSSSFTLLNLLLKTELVNALGLPFHLASGTIGKLSVGGLDSVPNRSGKVTLTLTDVTFVFEAPGKERQRQRQRQGGGRMMPPAALPAQLVATRRTLLEVMGVLCFIPLSFSHSCRVTAAHFLPLLPALSAGAEHSANPFSCQLTHTFFFSH
jgi:hypothetical protein